MKRVAALLGVLFLAAIAALAQVPGQSDDNGFLINLLENQLSTPGRQIRLHGVSGALSSRARVQQITVSDARGPWLEIDDAEIDWTRLQLLLGRVAIDRLSAGRIAWLRRAEPPPREPGLPIPQAETKPFAVPQLPVSIRVDAIDLPSITFDESVFGQAAELSASGSLTLRRGTLDTTLDIDRVDAPGGNLDLTASFSNADRRLAVDLQLHEPQGGVVATLLGIEGTPAIDLTLSGAGPLDEVDLEMTLDAGGARIAEGLVALRGRDDGLGFDVDLRGGLAPLVPAPFRDFFAGETTVRVAGVSKAAGGVRIDSLSLRGAELGVEGQIETGPDNFPRSVSLTGTLGDPAGPPVVLPVPGGRTRLNSAVFYIDYGAASRWNGLVVLDRLEGARIEVEDLTLRLGGLARNLDDPERRNVTVNLEGLATGVWSSDPDVAAALGGRIDLFADAALQPGGPFRVNQFQLSGNGLSVFSAGTFAGLTYTGRNAVRIDDLAILSGLADRPLGGSVSLRADGSVRPLERGFDLWLTGTANDLQLDDPRLDRLLAGETTIGGRAVRDTRGIRTEDLRIANPQLSFASDGSIASAMTEIGFTAALTDLALVDPRLSGSLTVDGRASGTGRTIDLTLGASIPEGRVMERALSGARLGFDGRVDGADVTGTIQGGGSLDGLVLGIDAAVSAAGGTRSVSGLALEVGPNRITGDVSRAGDAPLEGRLTLDIPDLAPLASLALVEATGSLDADVRLTAAETGQGVAVAASARDLAVAGNRVATLALDAEVTDALGLPLVQGELTATGATVAGIDIASLSARATQTDQQRMQVTASARLAVGTLIDAEGELARLAEGFAATLSRLDLRHEAASARLVAPATVTVAAGAVDLTPLELDFGTGHLTASGSVAESFDLRLDLTALPLNLANNVQPALGLAGTVTGTARVTGPRDAPDVRFSLDAAGVESAATRGAGLPPVLVRATGATAGGRMQLDARVGAEAGLAASVAGFVPMGEGQLDLAVDLEAFPLALVDRAAGRRGLAGSVTGTAHVTGALADPSVRFDLRGSGIGASVLRDNGIPPFGFVAAGGFAGGVATLDSASLSGMPGLELTGSGRVPLAGPGLDLRLSGTLPLALADPLLAQRSAQATGTLRLDARLQGALAAPQYSGNASLAGGTFVDPGTNLRLEDVAFDAELAGETATLRSFRARVSAGGEITAQGRVTLRGDLPASLGMRIIDVRYTDGAYVSTRLSGELSLEGPILGGGLLSGRIDLGPTEISVAEGLGAGAATTLEAVKHRRPPPRVVTTLERAGVGAQEQAPPRRLGLRLDIRINAPRQIFVRGRGLDVELGGALTIQGTIDDIQPVGAFELRRGRLIVLGQRIDFDEGSLTLMGDLDPQIRFVAQTQSLDVTAFVTVEGRASSPQITFSSEPELPQDEVLARILFNRTAQNLSAFQLAQLAAAAAELAGTGGPGILSQLRSATGLDDLDIVTEESGATALRAGRYLDENVYLEVQTDSAGVSRAEISLDLSDRVTARGSLGSDGDSTIGIFFERNY